MRKKTASSARSDGWDLVSNLRIRLKHLSNGLLPDEQAVLEQIMQIDLEALERAFQKERELQPTEQFYNVVSQEMTRHPEAADWVLQNYSGRLTSRNRSVVRASRAWLSFKKASKLKSSLKIEHTIKEDKGESSSNKTDSCRYYGEEYKLNYEKIIKSASIKPTLLDDTTFKFLSSWEFDIVAFAEKPEVAGMPILVLGHFIIIQSGLDELLKLNMDRVDKWLRSIEMSYQDQPYHNNLHGADVMCTMFYWYSSELFKANMSSLDMLSSIMAALAHDVGHDGVTNEFHINVWSSFAQRYNNVAPLENHHAALSIQLLSEDENNWLKSFEIADRFYIRSLFLRLILSTQSQQHQVHLENVKDVVERLALEKNEKLLMFDESNWNNERIFVLEAGLHFADLSNPAKPLLIAMDWAERIVKEFFAQGDRERELGIPVSPMCDRVKSDMEIGQSGFIKFVVLPSYQLWVKLIPEFESIITNLKGNLSFWENKKNSGVLRNSLYIQ